MFIEWDFLLAEIWVLLALAAVIGLLAGWLIWGGRKEVRDPDEVARLRAELDRAKAQNSRQTSDPLDDVPAMQGGGYVRPSAVTPVAKPVDKPVEKPAVQPQPQPQLLPVVAKVEPMAPQAAPLPSRPAALEGARDGLPDDLTKIKGIGPKLEKLCNQLGFWHYDQIAAWTAGEIAWVDDNLDGFKGRVTRDAWVDQARTLARDLPTFSRRRD